MSEHTGRRRAPRSGPAAMLICGLLGGALGALLWLAWRPSAEACGQVGECLGPVFGGVLMTAFAVPASVLTLWFVGVRRVLLTVVLGFTAAGALLLTVGDLMEVPATPGSVLPPLWSWVLIGAASGASAQWALQRGRSWLVRGGLLAVVVALVWGGTTWADRARDAERLDRFRAVGVDQVVVPQLEGYALAWARPALAEDEAPGPLLGLRLDPTEGEVRQARPDGSGTYSREVRVFLIPLQGRDACEASAEVDGDNRRECEESDGRVEARTWYGWDEQVQWVAAGAVHGDTLVYLRADPDALQVKELSRAAEEAESTTLEALRDL